MNSFRRGHRDVRADAPVGDSAHGLWAVREGAHDLSVDTTALGVEEPAPLVEIASVVLNTNPGPAQRLAAEAPVLVDDLRSGHVYSLRYLVEATAQVDVLAVHEKALVEA